MKNHQRTLKPHMQEILTDCRSEAEAADRQLREAIQCLREDNYLGALGSIKGIEARIQYLRTVLMRIDRIRVAQPREQERSHQRKQKHKRRTVSNDCSKTV